MSLFALCLLVNLLYTHIWDVFDAMHCVRSWYNQITDISFLCDVIIEMSIVFYLEFFYTIRTTQCLLLCQSKAHRNIPTFLCVIRNLLSHIDIIILWSQMGACSPIFQLLFIYLFIEVDLLFSANVIVLELIFENVLQMWTVIIIYWNFTSDKCVNTSVSVNVMEKTTFVNFFVLSLCQNRTKKKTKLILKHMIQCTAIEEHRRTAVVTHFQNCWFFSFI